jgi:prevent-host-death family protein
VTVHTFTVDVKNQVVSTPHGTCAYDNNGNLTGDGGTRTFSYDDENRLSQVFWGNGTYRTDFAYDGRDRLRTRREHCWTGRTIGSSSYALAGVRKVCILGAVEATLTELRRDTSRIVRAADRGEEVILTEHGRPAYRLQAYLPRVIFSDPDKMRRGVLRDDAILDAVRDAREDLADHQASA